MTTTLDGLDRAADAGFAAYAGLFSTPSLNCLFAGSLRPGKRAAAVMSQIQSARMSGLDPYPYLSDVLARLPTQEAHKFVGLLPRRW